MWHQDLISEKFEIRHRGESRPATKAEIKGLSEEVMYSARGLLAALHRVFAMELSKDG
jgi:hypothetical protein